MSTTTLCLLVSVGLVAAIFAWSGVSKIIRPFPAAVALTRFRLVHHVQPSRARILGVTELAITFALLLSPQEIWPLSAAAAVLVVFSVIVALALRRGDAFPCACFGSSSRPLSARTLARNLVLLAAACAGVVLAAAGVRSTLVERSYGVVLGALVVCAMLMLDRLDETRPFRADLGAVEP
jgi:hypothetical protein